MKRKIQMADKTTITVKWKEKMVLFISNEQTHSLTKIIKSSYDNMYIVIYEDVFGNFNCFREHKEQILKKSLVTEEQLDRLDK